MCFLFKCLIDCFFAHSLIQGCYILLVTCWHWTCIVLSPVQWYTAFLYSGIMMKSESLSVARSSSKLTYRQWAWHHFYTQSFSVGVQHCRSWTQHVRRHNTSDVLEHCAWSNIKIINGCVVVRLTVSAQILFDAVDCMYTAKYWPCRRALHIDLIRHPQTLYVKHDSTFQQLNVQHFKFTTVLST